MTLCLRLRKLTLIDVIDLQNDKMSPVSLALSFQNRPK
ncbi:hypothetical protein PTUN_a2850 [Pseudoalteromonas tunicata]|nr:hypothetical protein PTUN_a2850 [Pseudoalteromonas tunicata]